MRKNLNVIISCFVLVFMFSASRAQSPLFEAVEADNYDKVLSLINDGADANARDEDSMSVLMDAVAVAGLDVVTL